MPPSDAVTVGNVWLLAAASLLLGVAVFLVIMYIGRAVSAGGLAPVAGVIDETQRRLRREQGKQSSSFFALVLAVLPVVTRFTKQMPLDSLKKDLVERYARAGWPGGLQDDELVALGLMLGVGLMLLIIPFAAFLDPIYMPAAIIGLLLGPGLISNDLAGRATTREMNIARVMPFVLDLLVLTLRAGASMSMAMDRISEDYKRHPIGEEFKAILSDVEMGVTAREAFRAFGERVPIPSVRSFVDELIQSEELGRPIADTLERLSNRARDRRISEANALAGKAKVMVLVPGMLVFIATLILLFAPFGVKFYYGGFTLGN
jgi:tight adherence protein C